jgi:hypothetical protein
MHRQCWPAQRIRYLSTVSVSISIDSSVFNTWVWPLHPCFCRAAHLMYEDLLEPNRMRVVKWWAPTWAIPATRMQQRMYQACSSACIKHAARRMVMSYWHVRHTWIQGLGRLHTTTRFLQCIRIWPNARLMPKTTIASDQRILWKCLRMTKPSFEMKLPRSTSMWPFRTVGWDCKIVDEYLHKLSGQSNGMCMCINALISVSLPPSLPSPSTFPFLHSPPSLSL